MSTSNPEHQNDSVAELSPNIEQAIDQKVEQAVDDVVAENERLREENDALRERVAELEERVEKTEATAHSAKARATTAYDGVAELQSRELEKGAHLRESATVPSVDLKPDAETIESIEKEDGRTYLRLPNHEDPVGRGGSVTLSPGDLLPVQQLARLDEDMMASEARPVRLAVKAWENRDDVGDYGLWSKGSGDVDAYLTTSDLRDEIRSWETGVSKDYAKKLAQRTVDALDELTKGRMYQIKREHRKDGLTYSERRIVLPKAAEIPGETTTSGDR